MAKYSEEQKAAVMAALLAGQSVSGVAKEYKLPRGTVAGWSAELNRDAPVSNAKKAEVGELLVEYLRENLTTLREQVVVFRDPEWLRKQGASELAVLHGVLMDKSVRLLEAMGTADGNSAS